MGKEKSPGIRREGKKREREKARKTDKQPKIMRDERR